MRISHRDASTYVLPELDAPVLRSIALEHELLGASGLLANGFEDEDSSAMLFLDITDGTVISQARVHDPPSRDLANSSPASRITESSAQYDRAGNAGPHWPNHALLPINRHGGIRCPESENIRQSRSRFHSLTENAPYSANRCCAIPTPRNRRWTATARPFSGQKDGGTSQQPARTTNSPRATAAISTPTP
ncbi:hypothetical protein F9C11_17130 [Amycolatopsis sp. VS8301801F10]|uniref:hypothetical protein n=1 Tax=Amycolatopsis sp. VS8301801F10 TaxID=2652442 RepID=UPI0038FC5966